MTPSDAATLRKAIQKLVDDFEKEHGFRPTVSHITGEIFISYTPVEKEQTEPDF